MAGGTEETLASDATAAVVAAAGSCPQDSDWCTRLTVEREPAGSGTSYGFRDGDYGMLDDEEFDHGTTTYNVEGLWIWDPNSGSDYMHIDFETGRAPHGTVFDFGGTAFTANAGSEHPSDDTRYRWTRPSGFEWIDGQYVTVSANLAPGLVSAAVEGTTLVLTYDQALDTGSVPAASG